MRRIVLIVLFPFVAAAQFAPPAGQPGTTAMYKDSSAFVNWATFCVVTRGLQDVSNPSSGYANVGDSSMAIGKADNLIVSLGDAGIAVCTFAFPIIDGPGYDFAVFENSFSDDYLEFGFVEVSSDGVNFFRFPATSNTQDTIQTGPFDLSDASKVNNLAGKYRGTYGTPFDLLEMQGTPGLNINNITHVKIVDVVGSINGSYATYDNFGHKVNDPWPTAFPSGGFDLDAVGVIHDITNGVKESAETAFSLSPVPLSSTQVLKVEAKHKISSLEILSVDGASVNFDASQSNGGVQINISSLVPGSYFLNINCGNQKVTKKFFVLP